MAGFYKKVDMIKKISLQAYQEVIGKLVERKNDLVFEIQKVRNDREYLLGLDLTEDTKKIIKEVIE
jgi:hypothetical protein